MQDPTLPQTDPAAPTGEPRAAGPAAGALPPALPAGRYELLGEIARGGMGAVLRARDRGLNRDLAVKVIHPSSPAGPTSSAACATRAGSRRQRPPCGSVRSWFGAAAAARPTLAESDEFLFPAACTTARAAAAAADDADRARLRRQALDWLLADLALLVRAGGGATAGTGTTTRPSAACTTRRRWPTCRPRSARSGRSSGTRWRPAAVGSGQWAVGGGQ